MSLSIIIPCRNEEESIKKTIDKILSHLIGKIEEFEINIINDFSTDNTLDIIKKISNVNKNVKVYDNKVKGLGGAINKGIDKSLYKFTIIVTADLSDSPEDILKYYLEIKNNNLDSVLGTRFNANSKVENYPKNKLILFWNKYNDFTNSFKIYKTEILRNLRPIVSENFNVFLELPLKIISRKYNYSIIPIDWKNRKDGKAKFMIKEFGSMYLFTLLYCLLEKILLNKKVKK